VPATVAAGHGHGVAPVPIARLRYVKTSGVWSLYWRDGNLRFHVFDLVAPTASIQELLAELDRDPTAIFRGRVMIHLMQYAGLVDIMWLIGTLSTWGYDARFGFMPSCPIRN
jgi:hypothetical protein